MLKELGRELKKVREQRGLSLQTVAEPSKITAPYLQKLERGVVNTPSPRVLGRLANTLGIPYLHLMELAGYLDEEQLAEVRARAPKPHPLSDQELSAEEWRAIGEFVQELKARRPKTRQHSNKTGGGHLE
jgi:transcriptional regulator with XRE-family HTH domain